MSNENLQGLNSACDQITELEKKLAEAEKDYSDLYMKVKREKQRKKRVIIQVYGGVLSSVKIPKGIILECRDYDVGKTEELTKENSKLDENGERVYFWEEEG